MAKGATAKDNVEKIIRKAFGDDFIGVFDKKLYVWCDDGGEKVQISITLTVPKILRGIEETGDLNFEDNDSVSKITAYQPAEITQKEEETLADLMKKFGI